MKKTGWAALLIIGFGMTAPGVSSGQSILLRHHWTKGSTIKLHMTMAQRIDQAVPGHPFHIAQTIGIGFTYLVQDVTPNGTATIKTTFHSVSLQQISPAGSISYDSDHPAAVVPVQARPVAALPGQRFILQMTPRGQIISISGIDEMIGGMIRSIGTMPGAQAASMEKTFRAMFGPKAMREMMEKMSSIYPASPVSVGSSWHVVQSVSKPFPMTVGTTFKLTGLRGGVATIKAVSNIRSGSGGILVQAQGQNVKVLLSGTQTGITNVSEATGWQQSASFAQRVTGHVTVHSTAQPQTQSWPMSISGAGVMTTLP